MTSYEANSVDGQEEFFGSERHLTVIEGLSEPNLEPSVSELDDTLADPEEIDDEDNIDVLEQEIASTSSDSLQIYLDQLIRYKLLTASEETELGKRIEKGNEALALKHQLEQDLPFDPKKLVQLIGQQVPRDVQNIISVFEELDLSIQDYKEARETMVNANLRLVVSIAKRYRGHGVPFGDLIQEGNIGLIRAAEKFDWRKGFKFSTYATWWIRQGVQRSIPNQSRNIRIPVQMHDRILQVSLARRNTKDLLGTEPDIDEIAEATGLSVKQIEETKRANRIQPASLNVLISEETETEFIDVLNPSSNRELEDSDDHIELIDQIIKNEKLNEALKLLPERHRKVIEMRFGLDDDVVHTLEAIGKELGLTRERVRQIETDALRLLASGKILKNLQSDEFTP